MALKLVCSSWTAIHTYSRKTSSCVLRSFAKLTTPANVNLPKPPKRPIGAFFDFLLKNRPKVIANNPGINTRDVVRRTTEIYKNMPEAERQILKDEANVRYKAYKEQYAHFKSSLSPEQLTALQEESLRKKESRVKRKKKLSDRKYGRPRRPMNAYAIFVRASKVDRGNTSFVDFSRHLSKVWKDMPKEEKDIYNEEARIEREKYAERMTDWEELMLEEGHAEMIRGYRKPSNKKAKAKKKVARRATKNKAKKTVKTRKTTRTKKASKSKMASKNKDGDKS